MKDNYILSMNYYRKIIKHEPVISCREASIARGIELKEELKTLLIQVCQYNVAVHLLGSDKLNFKVVKRLFKCKNCVFINATFLESKGLQGGTINPWNTDFCHFHLICSRVFENTIMATNNSRRDEGVFFDVFELLDKKNVLIGNFGINE
jgi:hypothetical protein